ncbi:MAG: hypothetical protein EXS14_07250 [Planctomycetes bacterium]|nr:hypothetical protein [Planctomycetota bacterium]
MTRRIKQLHQAALQGFVELNRADAQALGVQAGEQVRLVTRRAARGSASSLRHALRAVPQRNRHGSSQCGLCSAIAAREHCRHERRQPLPSMPCGSEQHRLVPCQLLCRRAARLAQR